MMIKRILATDNDTAALILRVVLGVVFFAHGSKKLLGWFGGYGFDGTMQYFTQTLHIAYPLALLAVFTEFFGSLALLAGLLTRVAALGIGTIMVVAVAMVHFRYGFFMNWFGTQKGEGFEYHLLVLAMVAALLIKGAGRWSIDRMLSQRK